MFSRRLRSLEFNLTGISLVYLCTLFIAVTRSAASTSN